MSSGRSPLIRNQRFQRFQVRNCASASVFIARLGMVWNTFARQSVGAQRVVLGAAIEDERVRGLGEIGDRKKILGEQVGDEEALTVGEAFLDRSHHVAIRRHDQLAQGIVMAKKAAGRLIVREPERGAGQAFVLELAGLEQRGRRQLAPGPARVT